MSVGPPSTPRGVGMIGRSRASPTGARRTPWKPRLNSPSVRRIAPNLKVRNRSRNRPGPPFMKRIIFLNRFFFPDHSATSQILSDLAFYLAGVGGDIHVIASQQRYHDSR